jgi:signal transduction histidine kinase
MNDSILNPKSDGIGQLNHNILPTHQQWSKLESNRLLLEPRNQLISNIFRLLTIAVIYLYVPLGLVVVWGLLIFSLNYWIQHLTAIYTALLNSKPNRNIMTIPMVRIVRRYKRAWLVNCAIWCSLSFISQIWLPLTARLLCIAILNALMFLSITRTYVDRWLMNRILAIFVISQTLTVLLRILIGQDKHEAIRQPTVYALYLILMSYLLWVIGKRFNQMHLQRLDSEYTKLQLIEKLNESQLQLHVEQKALVTANKLVQQFYSGAAHDLRQPVYAMQLYTAMLSEEPAKVSALLPKIAKSCVSINDMFNTLFDYQQAHMHDMDLVETKINIDELLQNLSLHFQPIATAKGLQIRFVSISGSVNIIPMYLIRILSNLITNAIRYTNKGGVLVGVRKTHVSISFEIWDTGIGIDTPTIEHIFTEFYKVNKVDDDNDGLGLGLAIVKQLTSRIAQADISVQSRLGRGSVFKFTVPNSRYFPS